MRLDLDRQQQPGLPVRYRVNWRLIAKVAVAVVVITIVAIAILALVSGGSSSHG